jgi:molybdenum-dependent DNA-binding transcriptional regulator ModE
MKEIDDVGVAARVFKQATQGKRTEMGLPNDYLTMRGAELIRRYTELNAALQETEDETIDGEVTELDEAAEAS